MKKGYSVFGILLLISFIIGGNLPSAVSAASDSAQSQEWNEESGTDNEDNTQQDTEEEPIPTSYDLPVESNNIKGWPQGDKVEADAAVVMDAASGTFLYSKNMEAKEYPASITKIMTTLLALEYGKLDDVITFSENAVYSIEADSSNLGIGPGEQLTLRQALYGVMLASANEIANGVAEHIGGSVENFAQMMNKKAAELGCVNTNFVNPHGLHDENHYTCARDMALIMQAALKNKTFCKIINTTEYCYKKTNLCKEPRYFLNHHKMLYSDEDQYYKDCMGGKTGFTDQAWNTLVTYSKKDNRKLICVVLHENGAPKAYEETAKLLNYGFDNFKKVTMLNNEENRTFGEIMGMPVLGNSWGISEWNRKTFFMDKKSYMVVPIKASLEQIEKKLDLKKKVMEYTYQGYTIGKTAIEVESFPEFQTEPPFRQVSLIKSLEETQTEKNLPDEKYGFLERGKNMLDSIREVLLSTYDKVDLFIKSNTVESAVLGGILLIIFVPLLWISISRNRRYKRMRKERQAAEEMNQRLEEELSNMSLQEIENQIRRSQEEEQIAARREQDRRMNAEKARQDLEEAEKVLAESRQFMSKEFTENAEEEEAGI